jgi:hypothetical protein
VNFYHYTSHQHLKQILRDGYIYPSESNVSITQDRYGPDVVWLIDRPNLEYGHGLSFTDAPFTMVFDKTAVCVEVDIPAIKWTDWSYTHDMNSVWKEAFIASGGGREAADQWYVFPGMISVDRIININGQGVGEIAENIQQ